MAPREMSANEIRAEIRREVQEMDRTVASLVDWAEDEAQEDRDLIRHLLSLQFAMNSFLTMID